MQNILVGTEGVAAAHRNTDGDRFGSYGPLAPLALLTVWDRWSICPRKTGSLSAELARIRTNQRERWPVRLGWSGPYVACAGGTQHDRPSGFSGEDQRRGRRTGQETKKARPQTPDPGSHVQPHAAEGTRFGVGSRATHKF